jgi:hypothetical protein
MSNFFSSFDTFHEKADRIFGVVQVIPGGLEGGQHSASGAAVRSVFSFGSFPFFCSWWPVSTL